MNDIFIFKEGNFYESLEVYVIKDDISAEVIVNKSHINELPSWITHIPKQPLFINIFNKIYELDNCEIFTTSGVKVLPFTPLTYTLNEDLFRVTHHYKTKPQVYIFPETSHLTFTVPNLLMYKTKQGIDNSIFSYPYISLDSKHSIENVKEFYKENRVDVDLILIKLERINKDD